MTNRSASPRAYVAQLEKAHAFARPIVTRLEKLSGFYPAEDYHQDFAVLHPTYPYIVFNDAAEGGKFEAAVRGFLSRHAGHGDGVNEGRPLKEALPAAPPNDDRIARPPALLRGRSRGAPTHLCRRIAIPSRRVQDCPTPREG